jgi:hypothetical protein
VVTVAIIAFSSLASQRFCLPQSSGLLILVLLFWS